jgi:phospholipid-binding lipoprotein MlaA
MNMVRGLFLAFFLFGSLSTTAAWADSDDLDFLDDAFYDDLPEQPQIPDPFESFNRVMFTFNDYAYTWVMQPVASTYSEVVPQDIRQVIDNFCYNFQEPVRFVNSLLQMRFSDAGTVFLRFAINTIGGVGGLGDPAGREFGLKPVDASFGETLAFWGIGDGVYLVAPVIGATTVRELSGTLFDGLVMTPYYFLADGLPEVAGISAGRRLNSLSLRLGEYEAVTQMSVDPYTAFRNGYFQRREQARRHSLPLDDKL